MTYNLVKLIFENPDRGSDSVLRVRIFERPNDPLVSSRLFTPEKFTEG